MMKQTNTPWYFEQVLFSDECMLKFQQWGSISLRGPPLRTILWSLDSTEEKGTMPQLSWWYGGGVISRDGERTLIEVEGKLNADNYNKIIEKNLIEFEDIDEMIFQQDLAPCHRANKILQYLADWEIEFLNWVPNSPDMNSIENVWSWPKNESFKRRQKIKNK
jgi:transposase